MNGKDYRGGEGTIEFKHGETHRAVNIPIIDDMEFEKDENFEVRTVHSIISAGECDGLSIKFN